MGDKRATSPIMWGERSRVQDVARSECQSKQKGAPAAAEATGEARPLRVAVDGGGCSGFTYDLYFEDETTDLDQVFESAGIKLFIDMMSYQSLENTEIDYVEGLHGAGFKFLNPTAKSTCGCGSSFSA